MSFIPVMEYKSKQTLVIRIQKTNHLHACVQGGGGGGFTKTNSKAYFLSLN